MPTKPLADARWIWCNHEPERLNQYGLFRRTFRLPRQHGPVRVYACADTRYWLYVNGSRVHFGPGKYDWRKPLYDTHDITAYVKPGLNLVAFKVHAAGDVEGMSSFMPIRGGLIAEVRWDGGSVSTDAAWKSWHETAYAADTPRKSNHQSFIECFDARQAQRGWNQPEFRDGRWPNAWEIPPDRRAPWGPLAPKGTRNLTLIPRRPCRVIETGRSTPAGDPANMQTLAKAMHYAERHPSNDVTLDAKTLFPVHLVAPKGGKDAAYAVFDFVENSSGYIVLRLHGKAGTIVDIGTGEGFDHGMVRCEEQGVKYVDRVILGDGPLDHHLMFPKTFSYLLLEVRGGEATVEDLSHEVSTQPVRWDGSFVCAERPTLSRVWQIGAHTVQLCMEDCFMDTPRRERAGWLGDMVPEAMAAYYAFGDTAVARHALDLFMQSQTPEGWVSGRYPSKRMTNMPTWNASYGMALADYVRYSGDLDFARQVWPGVRRLTGWFERQRQPDDLMIVYPQRVTDPGGVAGYVLVDWTPIRLDGAVSVMNMYYCRYLDDCAWLAAQMGNASEAAQLAALAARTRRATRTLLFDRKRGIFTNCRSEAGLSQQAGAQENLLALLWDVASPAQAKQITRAIVPSDDPLPLYDNPDRDWFAIASGVEPWDETKIVPVGSPFFMYFALGALFEVGRTAAALNNIDANYGSLLARGETTVWEDYSGDTSRSHGWGAGPTVFGGKYLLGVEPTSPGFKTFSVLPAFGYLHRASGRVPTPHGTIEVNWERDAKSAKLTVVVPPGTRALAGLPASGRSRLRCDGKTCASAQTVNLRRGRFRACVLRPGTHVVEL